MGNERGKILDDAKAIINGERQNMYGDPEDNFAAIADFWTVYQVHSKRKHSPAHDAAMKMALMKVARICTGTGGRDSYVDLCGYTALAADIAEREVVDTSSGMA